MTSSNNGSDNKEIKSGSDEHGNNSTMDPFDLELCRIAVDRICKDNYFIHYQEIVRKMLRTEEHGKYGPGFCNNGGPTKSNIARRRMVISWLRDISNDNACDPECLGFAVFLLDLYLNNSTILVQRLHLAAAACFYLANRIKDTMHVSTSELASLSNGRFTHDELDKYVEQLMLIINEDLFSVNPLDFIDPLAQLADLNEDNIDLLRQTAVNIYIICIHCVCISKFRPCIIASACLMACLAIDFAEQPEIGERYGEMLVSLLKTNKKELEHCYNHLRVCMQEGDPSEHDVGCDKEIVVEHEDKEKQEVPTEGAAAAVVVANSSDTGASGSDEK